MAAVLLSSAMFAALLLPLSPTGAGADLVAMRKCQHRERVLQCHLTDLRSGDFDGLPNVHEIVLMYNYDIAHVDPAAFSAVPKLERLIMIHNILREVPVFDEHSFCPNLTHLDLSDNQITEIKHPKTFAGCLELTILNLARNAIEYINPDVFHTLKKLNVLFLQHNKIKVIPATLLINKIQLRYLELKQNKIAYLPSDFVSKIRSAGLWEFNFDDNPWHCACLLELLADVKRTGVKEYYRRGYPGTHPACVYSGAYPCCRPASSGLLGRAGRRPSSALAKATP